MRTIAFWLPGNTRAEVRPEFDRGRVDDSFPLNGIQLQLRRSPERERAAEELADDLQRAGSSRFHKWLHRPPVRGTVRRSPRKTSPESASGFAPMGSRFMPLARAG